MPQSFTMRLPSESTWGDPSATTGPCVNGTVSAVSTKRSTAAGRGRLPASTGMRSSQIWSPCVPSTPGARRPELRATSAAAVWSAAPVAAEYTRLRGIRTQQGPPWLDVPANMALRAATAEGRAASPLGGTAGGSRSSHRRRSTSGRPDPRVCTSGRSETSPVPPSEPRADKPCRVGETERQLRTTRLGNIPGNRTLCLT